MKLLTANSQVTEKEPPTDQWFLWVPGWFIHDVQIRRVEPQCSGRQAICHQIDPEELDRNQSLRKSKGCCQENTVSTQGKKRTIPNYFWPLLK